MKVIDTEEINRAIEVIRVALNKNKIGLHAAAAAMKELISKIEERIGPVKCMRVHADPSAHN